MGSLIVVMRKNRQKGMNGSKGNDYSVISNYSVDPLHISTCYDLNLIAPAKNSFNLSE